MKITDTVKEHPLTIGSILTIASLVGIAAAIDSRYASAADIKTLKEDTSKEIRDLRVQHLEDKLFELKLKIESKQATPVEKAMHERYQNQRETLIRER